MNFRYFTTSGGGLIPLSPASVAEMDMMHEWHSDVIGYPLYSCEDGRVWPYIWPDGCVLLEVVDRRDCGPKAKAQEPTT